MLQRAALACGDDVDDSPEFLKLQERSCSARITEIDEELHRRGASPASLAVLPDEDTPDESVPAPLPARAPAPAPTPAPAPAPAPAPRPQQQLTSAPLTPASSTRDSPAPTEESVSRAQTTHPWSAQVTHSLKRIFKLEAFRPDQLEAINATLGGRDVFCLMPTGGGKSLCYQLPATVTKGATDGLTVVVSPLLALISNQVKHMLRLRVPTLAITSEMSESDRKFASSELYKPQLKVRLLYVTPEFVSKARLASSVFQYLYSTRRLARFVIDEAHCVDQWGHDFRPDYVRLSRLREQFPSVPIMALTATARINTIKDIQTQLGMRDAVVLRQSFNRPNLTYRVEPKRAGGATLECIAEFVRTSHAGECGIIYCLSRRDCENVASDLSTRFGIRARHFHAGLANSDKASIQDGWERGEFLVIVATIAFGMGIDKPDVRFVIHHSMPKSLEGYYQETGRAGRDGERAECVLYWSMNDSRRLETMINDSPDASPEQKRLQLESLAQVKAFCLEVNECRRTNILKYFSETFDPRACRRACDNCQRTPTQATDMTTSARDFLAMVRLLDRREHYTRTHCHAMFRGSMRRDVTERGLHLNMYHGRGASLRDADLKRLIDHMLAQGMLSEYARKANYQRFPNHYLRLGPAAAAVLAGERTVELAIPGSAPAPAPAPAPRPAQQGHDTYSGPPTPRASRPVYSTSGGSTAPRPRFRAAPMPIYPR